MNLYMATEIARDKRQVHIDEARQDLQLRTALANASRAPLGSATRPENRGHVAALIVGRRALLWQLVSAGLMARFAGRGRGVESAAAQSGPIEAGREPALGS